MITGFLSTASVRWVSHIEEDITDDVHDTGGRRVDEDEEEEVEEEREARSVDDEAEVLEEVEEHRNDRVPLDVLHEDTEVPVNDIVDTEEVTPR
jgi:hypothetical protein